MSEKRADLAAVEVALDNYRVLWLPIDQPELDRDRQAELLGRCEELLHSAGDCLHRHNQPGHFTGSALILNADGTKVLLTLHAKLKMWLQLGGHADGDGNLAQVALREAAEESGLSDLEFCGYEDHLGLPHHPVAFDLDIHEIPANSKEPRHFHYDVRYLLRTRHPEKIKLNSESKELRWFAWAEAYQITSEPSMHRQFDKWAWLKEQGHLG